MNFDRFFQAATGHCPYDYQRRLAGPDPAACQSRLIHIPTGLGKTAAVVLAWLWNRLYPSASFSPWPRRLVYCLPMRTLVEQTSGNVTEWLAKLSAALPGNDDLKWLAGHSPVILMGGEELEPAKRDWDIHPEKPCILIGTQDMLLSRALNRGYGMSRYRWPMHFGLLNNDCLWVMDETQLMGPGLATACQLEAFRLAAEQGTEPQGLGSMPDGRSVTWYSSATANEALLHTREWRDIPRSDGFAFGLTDVEKAATTGPVSERRQARKAIELHPEWHFGGKQTPPAAERTDGIVERHVQMVISLTGAPLDLPRRTLVICNTVDRAVAMHQALQTRFQDGNDTELVLLHSRFRPPERQAQAEHLGLQGLPGCSGGQIIIATQVIEAGVDLSSAILWTEIAPLASLVQRLGRLNRKGEFGHADQSPHGFTPQAIVVGIDQPIASPEATKQENEKAEKEVERRHLPYAKNACDAAWDALKKLKGQASSVSLQAIQAEIAASIPGCLYSLQRHELMDFFDTGANLSLGFTDVSPFVRGVDTETDLQVLWREDWPGCENGKAPDFQADFQRDELCPVPIGKANEAHAILDQGWLWRGKDTGWIRVRQMGDLMPGMTIVLPISAGGYSKDHGWTGNAADKPASCYETGAGLTDEELLASLANGWRSIAAHSREVSAEFVGVMAALGEAMLSESEHEAFKDAVRWHDVGKNHAKWQGAAVKALLEARLSPPADCRPLAKFSFADSPTLSELSGDGLKREMLRLRRSFDPRVAHEVASALAFRQTQQARHGTQRPLTSLLAEYIIMSHHGRVRKVLRDELPRFPKDAKDTDAVRGIADGDPVPPVAVDGMSLGAEALSTDGRRMGRDSTGHESYTRGVLRLLDHYGPFRLAFFEALFRAADILASIRAKETSH